MEEDRHLDGRACFAVACGVVSVPVVLASTEIGVFFGAAALIFAGASVVAVDEPASPRTRRTALVAALLTLPAIAMLVVLLRPAAGG